jgi:hypothetical protein
MFLMSYYFKFALNATALYLEYWDFPLATYYRKVMWCNPTFQHRFIIKLSHVFNFTLMSSSASRSVRVAEKATTCSRVLTWWIVLVRVWLELETLHLIMMSTLNCSLFFSRAPASVAPVMPDIRLYDLTIRTAWSKHCFLAFFMRLDMPSERLLKSLRPALTIYMNNSYVDLARFVGTLQVMLKSAGYNAHFTWSPSRG